jgi:drug/metabolite transporter (DMT)-like permease
MTTTAAAVANTHSASSTVMRGSSKLLIVGLLTLVAGAAMIAAAETYLGTRIHVWTDGHTVQAVDSGSMAMLYSCMFGFAGVTALIPLTLYARARSRQQEPKAFRSMAILFSVLVTFMLTYGAMLAALRNTGVRGVGYVQTYSGLEPVDYLIPNESAMKALIAIGSLVALGGAGCMVASGCTFYTAHKLAQKQTEQSRRIA